MSHSRSARPTLLGAAPAGARAAPRPRSLHDHVLSLQRSAGNRAVRRMLQRDTAQTKTTPPAASRARALPPWDRVWIGTGGLLGEVVEKGVTVRMYRDWAAIGVKKPEAYECGAHDRRPIPGWATKMRDVARQAAAANDRLPAGSAQRVAIVAITGDSSSSAYRIANGRGLVVVGIDVFDAGTYPDTLAHETSHGLYEHHSIRKGKPETRAPDRLALRVADLYSRLDDTAGVPIPKGRFNARKPPPLEFKGKETGRSAGHVMVMDELWAPGGGGHPWDGPDEFFASAYGAYRTDPELLKRSIAHYARKDERITAWGKELLELLAIAGDDTAADALTAPADPKQALAALKKAGAPLDVSGSPGALGWLIDPELMPGPGTITCTP